MPEVCRDLKPELLRIIKMSSKIFITGHSEPDFDSIGSAIGMLTLCQSFGKESYIIVDDDDVSLEPGVKRIIDINKGQYHIIKLNDFIDLTRDDKDSTLIVVDANKKYQVSATPFLDRFQNVVIIDHHNPDQHTIPATASYINSKASSSAELVSKLLNSCKVRYDANVANYLLAGIELDTNRYKKNTSSVTHDVAEKLIIHGANPDYVNELFLAEFEADKRVNNLVYNGTLFAHYQHYQISFTLNRENPNKRYRKEDLAKAADKAQKYQTDASFAIGFVNDGLISISARSKGYIDVGEIMEEFTGGGNTRSAACKIQSTDVISVEEKLKSILEEKLNNTSTDYPTDSSIMTEKQYVKVKD